MIQFRVFGIGIQISFLYVAFITLLTLYDQTGAAVWGVFSSFFHEGCHVITLMLLGGRPKEIELGICGIRMYEPHMLSLGRQLTVLSAGCLGNFILFSLCLAFGDLTGATINLCLGLFNMLPSYALDGGQILMLLIEKWFPYSVSRWIYRIISVGFSAALLLIGIKLIIAYHNPTLLLTSIFLMFSTFVS